MFRRVAIVNRGEAALRFINAAKELSRELDEPITTIAFYTSPDAESLYVREADETYCLGPAQVVEPSTGRRISSYLDLDTIERALRDVGADAVWPGWGFASEDPTFVELCTRVGVTFIGPSADAMRRLGDKIEAKRLAAAAGLAVTDWSGGALRDESEAREHAERIGYPVMLKAAAGGGGRGIRLVEGSGALADALQSTRREAGASFGDDRVYLEAVVGRARHVEVQVAADRFGDVRTLGIRDCSVQRRNQKMIEESASTALTSEEERSVSAGAAELCRLAAYEGVGTVELLYEPSSGDTYFMEVNTRLQVEHTVTEETTGVDLVKLQMHLASGGRVGDVTIGRWGHAVEARLNAEDPANGMAPSAGRLVAFDIPRGPGIRVDTGYAAGDVIPAEFDSMIAKVVAWGRTRSEALARLHRALSSAVVVVAGGATNRTALVGMLEHPEVLGGHVDIGWFDRTTNAGGLLGVHRAREAVLLAATEAYELASEEERWHFISTAARGRADLRERRNSVTLSLDGSSFDLAVYRLDERRYRIQEVAGQSIDVAVERLTPFERRLTLDGRSVTAVSIVDGPAHRIEMGSENFRVTRGDAGVVTSPSPGLVVAVPVKVGDHVEAGQVVVVVEAMKLETAITAPFGAEVLDVAVEVNRQVDAGDPLVRLDLSTDVSPAGGGPVERLIPVTDEQDIRRPAVRGMFEELRYRLLGFDADPVEQVAWPERLGIVISATPADSVELLEAENSILRLFADVAMIARRDIDRELFVDDGGRPNREQLASFLRSPERAEQTLPQAFLDNLRALLNHYGIHGIERTPELDEALVRIHQAQLGLDREVANIIGILDRRIRHCELLRPVSDASFAALLARLVSAADGNFPSVAEFARVARHRYVDEPVLDAVAADTHAMIVAALCELVAAPDPIRRADLVDQVRDCPEDLRPLLISWILTGSREHRLVALEMLIRRLHRVQHVQDVQVDADREVVRLRYLDGGSRFDVVATAGPLNSVARLLERAGASREIDADHVVLDLLTWTNEGPDEARSFDEVHRAWGLLSPPPTIDRVDVTVEAVEGVEGVEAFGSERPHRAKHCSYRTDTDGSLREESLYRDLHPMVAERLEVWRLRHFELERLQAPDGIYLFRGVARENERDERLFAITEVYDLTPLGSEQGSAPAFPVLERTLRAACSAMRRAEVRRPHRDRLLWNRVTVFVRPRWTMSDETLREVLRRLAPSVQGLGLGGQIILRVREQAGPDTRDIVLHASAPTPIGMAVGRTDPSDDPIRPLSDARLSMIRQQRRGGIAPRQVIELLTSPSASESDFPVGEFIEYDLDAGGEFGAVERPAGQNTANVVVGTVVNTTDEHPDGMHRVLIIGDAGRSMGSLAEPECRRILAALELAERLGLPVEWFAVSSGARVAMDSGVENMDWTAAVLRRIVEMTEAGHEINIITIGPNVGAQSYWNAEAAMLMHTRGVVIMLQESSMVLTGKHALDASGGVSAEDNVGIGGFERIMGSNGEGHYLAADLASACSLLFAHYEHTYRGTEGRATEPRPTDDPVDRNVCLASHPEIQGADFARIGDIFDLSKNPDRKKPFDMRALMRAVVDQDRAPIERWQRWHGAETGIVWDAHLGGRPICLLGIESKPVVRTGALAADGPEQWSSGTLFPQSSKKIARALNAASANRPVVVLGNLSGFDGSPESMRGLQLEMGAEIGRAVVNFTGPLIFCVVSRYHGGAFVVFSKALNEDLYVMAVQGSHASVIGGAPAAKVVFAREVAARVRTDPRLIDVEDRLTSADSTARAQLAGERDLIERMVTIEKQQEVADEYDRIHSIERARQVGAVDEIIDAASLRPSLIRAIERGLDRDRLVGAPRRDKRGRTT